MLILTEFGAGIETLHFLSDRPATQYRCQFMFTIIIQEIIPLFPDLKFLTWNFSESGHGKGAADGVGATLKRTADHVVANEGDVSNIEQFISEVMQRIKGIRIIPVLSVQNEELAGKIKKCSKPVKGTMKIHQIQWSKYEKNKLYFNTLSCFTCKTGKCIHYPLTEIDYSDSMDHKTVHVSERTVPEASQPPVPEALEPIKDALVEDDWVVVRFQVEEGKGERKWLGKIERINKNDTFLINFLRPQVTRLNSGFIYSYPKKEDHFAVCKSQILYSVTPPQILHRGIMKFAIHHSALL